MVSIGTDPEGHPGQGLESGAHHTAARLRQPVHQDPPQQPVDLGGYDAQPRPGAVAHDLRGRQSRPEQVHKCWEAASYGRAVHFEYNKQGTEVWVSIWGDADKPGEIGEIVIYDDATLEEIARIKDLVTPTGKFNVYNTVNDVY